MDVPVNRPRQDGVVLREEVFEAQRSAWVAHEVIRPPAIGWWVLAGAALSFALMGAVLVFGTYSDIERAAGVLRPSAGMVTVTATSAGMVKSVPVREGQKIGRGDVVARIASGQESAEMGSVQGKIRDQIALKMKQIAGEAESSTKSNHNQQSVLAVRISALETRAKQLSSQVLIQNRRLAGFRLMLDRLNEAGKRGIVSQAQVLQQQDAALQVELSLRQTEAELSSSQDQAREARLQMDDLKEAEKRMLLKRDRDIADQVTAEAENAAKMSTVIRAPMSGTIAFVAAREGQSVQSGDDLMTVGGEQSGMQAELWVPSASISKVHVGQVVRIRFARPAGMESGKVTGRIVQLSSGASGRLSDSGSQDKHMAQGEFRAVVRPAAGEDWLSLRPGMRVDGEIVTGRHRLIAWVFSALRDLSHAEANQERDGLRAQR